MNTMQFEFDEVVKHLFVQGKPSMTGEGLTLLCAYRGDFGNSCAVGCRIPDLSYKKEMEGMFFTMLLENFEKELPKEMKEYCKLFSKLQSCHDDCRIEKGKFSLADLKFRLACIAKDLNLRLNIPKEFQ